MGQRPRWGCTRQLVVTHSPAHYQRCLFLTTAPLLDDTGDLEEKLESFISELKHTPGPGLEKTKGGGSLGAGGEARRFPTTAG